MSDTFACACGYQALWQPGIRTCEGWLNSATMKGTRPESVSTSSSVKDTFASRMCSSWKPRQVPWMGNTSPAAQGGTMIQPGRLQGLTLAEGPTCLTDDTVVLTAPSCSTHPHRLLPWSTATACAPPPRLQARGWGGCRRVQGEAQLTVPPIHSFVSPLVAAVQHAPKPRPLTEQSAVGPAHTGHPPQTALTGQPPNPPPTGQPPNQRSQGNSPTHTHRATTQPAPTGQNPAIPHSQGESIHRSVRPPGKMMPLTLLNRRCSSASEW